jgi:oligopeptide/dipeptide ABC transporter ATP-binding protein
MTAPLLDVRDLRVSFPTPAGTLQAVSGVSFTVRAGQRVGICGESGAGKSVVALAIMGLLARPPAEVSGDIRLDGQDLLALPNRRLRHVRGARIGMVFQEPVASLNPAMTIGAQLVEALRAHTDLGRRAARERAIELLARVGLPAPARRLDDYPHQFSGGMAQRVMIAIAVSSRPQLVIADEPTTALDVSIEAQIIDLLVELSEEQHTAVMLITHDLGVLARFAQRVVVMYAGRIVEQGPAEAVYTRPAHPYTAGLLASVPRADHPAGGRLPTIPGTPPSPLEMVAGCPFVPRCPAVTPECLRVLPQPTESDADRACACHHPDSVTAGVRR